MAGRRRVRWSTLADADFDRAHAYWADQSSRVGRRFAQSIRDAVLRIRDFPEMGAPATDLQPEGRYRSVVAGYYRVIYVFDGAVITILRVWDTRRDPATLLVVQEPTTE